MISGGLGPFHPELDLEHTHGHYCGGLVLRCPSALHHACRPAPGGLLWSAMTLAQWWNQHRPALVSGNASPSARQKPNAPSPCANTGARVPRFRPAHDLARLVKPTTSRCPSASNRLRCPPMSPPTSANRDAPSIRLAPSLVMSSIMDPVAIPSGITATARGSVSAASWPPRHKLASLSMDVPYRPAPQCRPWSETARDRSSPGTAPPPRHNSAIQSTGPDHSSPGPCASELPSAYG